MKNKEKTTPQKPLSLEEREIQIKATTAARHREEINLVEKLLTRYLAGFRKIDKFIISKDNELEYAWLLLTTRSFNSLRCAFDLLQKGYYSQAMMLIRSVFEDWLTAKDCEKHRKTLDAFIEGENELGKGEFHYSDMAKRLSPKFPETWKTIYGSLSTIAHARKPALEIMINENTKDLRLGSHYDDKLFLATYQVLLAAASIIAELIYKILGNNATEWWEETLPTAQAVNTELVGIGNGAKISPKK